MAIYDNKTGGINWREQHLYGSTRTGMWLPDVKLGTDSAVVSWGTIGTRRYELKDHLENVLVTISDNRVQRASGSSLIGYDADVYSAQDHFAFGGLMQGRQYQSGTYRYGFNGKENDNDAGKGIGGQQDYGMRIYDPLVGRFLSVDPLQHQYPELTPYQFASNSPVKFIDLDGKEAVEAENEGMRELEELDPRTEEVHRSLKYPEEEYRKHDEELKRQEEAQRKVKEDEIIKKSPGERVPKLSNILGNIKGRFSQYLNDLPENTANALGNQTLDFKRLIEEGAKANLSANRFLPGTATGTGIKVNGQWLRGTQGNAAFIPNSIAVKLRGRGFNSFDEFRSAFWKEVAADKELSSQFSKIDFYRMKAGYAPLVQPGQTLGGQKSYILHHITPIGQGGGVYDMNNIIITTPLYHNSILTPQYHYGGQTNGPK